MPKRNLVPKPPELSFEHAACLPTAWLTAYRMLFTRGAIVPGMTVLVQGAAGGVATALTVLGSAAGARIWVTSRSEEKRVEALKLGADQAFESGARLPERVDAVMETVGQATWKHSIRSLKPGGKVVVSGRHLGPGTRSGAEPGVLPPALGDRLDDGNPRRARAVDPVLPGARHSPGGRRHDAPGQAREGFQAMLEGDIVGKIVFTT